MFNTGVAFGIGQGVSVWVALIFLVGVVIIAVKTRELWARIGLVLMIVGGSANLLMRIRYGGVIDNWSIGGMLYNNVWDYLIVGGLIIYGYAYFGTSASRRFSKSASRKVRGSDKDTNTV